MKKSEVEAYEENVGHPPKNLPDDHPDVWQWEYKGTKEDKERLEELLREEEPEQDTLF